LQSALETTKSGSPDQQAGQQKIVTGEGVLYSWENHGYFLMAYVSNKVLFRRRLVPDLERFRQQHDVLAGTEPWHR